MGSDRRWLMFVVALAALAAVVPLSSAAAQAGPGGTVASTTPRAGSPERTAILDAVRRQLKSTSRFKVDHVRVAGRWAFVRATEVVPLDGDELQETDLTIAALLEQPVGSTTGAWRVADYWTLPGENGRPLAAFTRRVRERVRTEKLPGELLPGDF